MNQLIKEWQDFWFVNIESAEKSQQLTEYKKIIEKQYREINKALFSSGKK